MFPFEVRHFIRITAGIVNRARRKLVRLDNIIANGDTMVIFTKCRCLVNDPGTVRRRHIFVGDDPERPILVLE